MRQTIPALAAVLVVVVTVAVVPAAGVQANSGAGESALAQQESGNGTADGNETADDSAVAPGQRLAGVVGVQGAEVDGEVESRSFGLAVARAASDDARAALIAAEVDETDDEVRNLSERRERLRQARENGSVSEGEYRARIAELAARSANAERMANRSADASQGLPEDVLRANGVNVTAIQTLRQRASELGGQEVAGIARSIAGGVDRGLGERPGPVADRGERPEPAGDRDGSATDRQRDDPLTEDRENATTGTVPGPETNRTSRPGGAGGERGR